MNPSEQDTTLRELHEKFSGEPLIHLVRRLIVALDQTEAGSHERQQTLDLLSLITQEQEIPARTSLWLDWLDQVDEEEIAWDKLMDTGPPARKVVEVPEDPMGSNSGARAPLSKEQLLWDKALKRSEGLKSKQSRPWTKLVGLALLCALGFLGYRHWPEILRQAESMLEPATPAPLPMAQAQPNIEWLWSNYQTRQQNVPDPQVLSRLWSQEAVSPPQPLRDDDIRQPPPHLIAWGRLCLQEKTLNENDVPQSDATLPLRSLPLGSATWDVTRHSGEGQSWTFTQSQAFKMNGRRLEMSVRRRLGTDGVAHRVLLDPKGLVAWSWRIVWQGVTIDGQAVRKGEGIQWLIRLPGGQSSRGETPLPRDAFVLPALVTPALQSFQHLPVFHPIEGKVTSGEIFWGDGELAPWLPGGSWNIRSRLSPWREEWKATTRVP